MQCPNCHKEKAQIHKIYGALPCVVCTQRQNANNLPNEQVEMVGDDIKKQRVEQAKSIIQPYRSGELSKEYLENFGTKNIKPTDKEIKNAKYVWSDITKGIDIKKTK